MTSDLIKRLRTVAAAMIDGQHRVVGMVRAYSPPDGTSYNDMLAVDLLLAATALERGVWKPDEEAVARVIAPRAWEKSVGGAWRYRDALLVQKMSLAKARDILALPSLVEGLEEK